MDSSGFKIDQCIPCVPTAWNIVFPSQVTDLFPSVLRMFERLFLTENNNHVRRLSAQLLLSSDYLSLTTDVLLIDF